MPDELKERAAKQWVDDYRRLMGVEPDFIPETIADRHPKQMIFVSTPGIPQELWEKCKHSNYSGENG